MELSLRKKILHLFSVSPAALKLGFMHCLESPTFIALYYLCIADKFREIYSRTRQAFCCCSCSCWFYCCIPLESPPPAQPTRDILAVWIIIILFFI